MDTHQLLPGHVVVIIGAGFGGIIAAIYLKKELGFKNFLIYEKGSDIGGTWRENTYPGCLSDIAIQFYSISTDLKDDWDNTCEEQPSILNYMKDVVRKQDLGPHLILNTEVVGAQWDATAQTYEVTTADTKTGLRSTLAAQIVLSAHGMLHIPKMPTIPGLESFRGTVMHSARWDESLDLRGKRVAVIGNGSTGAQLMARLPKIEGIQVTQFYRTKNWHLPSIRVPMADSLKWVLQNVPFASRLYRWLMFWAFESTYHIIFKSILMRAPLVKIANYFVRKVAPKEYHEMLTPDFPVGCRRIVYDAGFLSALHRPNVDIRRNAIAEVTPQGITTPDGEKILFDVIICATGFVVDTFPIDIRGNGCSVQEYYDKTVGPNAYLGATIPGFPNLCLLFGPNTATGYTSVLFFTETQMQYITKLIKPILDGVATSFEVTEEANDQYNRSIQDGMKHTVWTSCSSWYKMGGSGRNTTLFPWSQITFWWWCLSVDWNHYKVSGLKGGADSLKKSPMNSLVAFMGLGLAVLFAALRLVS